MIRSRFWSLTAWKIQTQALSPSWRKKNTRNAARITTVMTPAADATMSLAAPATTARSWSVIAWASRPMTGGRLSSTRRACRAAIPSVILATIAATDGSSMTERSSIAPPRIASAAAQTIAAAAVRDRPRARSRRANGANAAAMTMAMAVEAVTIQSSPASSHSTTRSAAMAMTRQPRAARLTSQSGMTAWVRLAGAVMVEPRCSCPAAGRGRMP